MRETFFNARRSPHHRKGRGGPRAGRFFLPPEQNRQKTC